MTKLTEVNVISSPLQAVINWLGVVGLTLPAKAWKRRPKLGNWAQKLGKLGPRVRPKVGREGHERNAM